MAQAFVVVVNRYCQRFFCVFLTDNVVVEVGNDFGRGRQFFLGVFFFRFDKLVFNFAGLVVLQHYAASFYTFVADEGVFAFDQVFNVVFRLPAE